MLAGILATVLVGCESEVGQPAPAKPVLSAPEESFNRILERIKRRLEHGSEQSFTSAGLDPDSAEVSHFSYEDEVSGQVVKPEEKGGNYTARIIIKTSAVFIHTQSPPKSTTSDNEPQPNGSSIDSLLEGDPTISPFSDDAILPDELAALADEDQPQSDADSGGSDRPRTQMSEPEVTYETYDLAYEEGRWVLKTKVEKESTELIFEFALAGQ